MRYQSRLPLLLASQLTWSLFGCEHALTIADSLAPQDSANETAPAPTIAPNYPGGFSNGPSAPPLPSTEMPLSTPSSAVATNHPGGEFSSNEELEQLSGVVAITGALRLAEGISDLSALSSLTSVAGDLMVESNSELTSLGGFESLTTVGGIVIVERNSALTSLLGLNSLRTTGGLHVNENDLLTSFDGLESLTTVGGAPAPIVYDNLDQSLAPPLSGMSVVANPALTSFAGLESLTFIGGSLAVRDNASLTSFTGLESLATLGGYLDVRNNASLTSFDGLESLTAINDELRVFENAALTSFAGLEFLTTVRSNFFVERNDALTSLVGLESLRSVWAQLSVQDNNALTSLEALESLDQVPVLTVAGNLALAPCWADWLRNEIEVEVPNYLNRNNTGTGTCAPSLEQQNVEEFLTEYCGACHISPATFGSLGYVNDIDRLIENGLMVPGSRSDSSIYRRMIEGIMPPSYIHDLRPSFGQVEAVGQFIDSL